MALATQCPHCKTTFRVASDQLKLRGGIVRCGTCHQVFDGNAALVDMEAVAANVPVADNDADAAAQVVAAPIAVAEVQLAPLAVPDDDLPEPDTAAALDMAPESEPAHTLAEDDMALPAVLQPEPGYVLDYDLSEPDEVEALPILAAEAEHEQEPHRPVTSVDFDLSDDADLEHSEPEAAPVETIDFDLGGDSLLGAPDAPRAELSLSDEVAFSSDEADPAVDLHAVVHTRPLPDLDTGPLPLLRQSAVEPEPEQAPVPELAEPEEIAPDPDEPEFVRLARDKELAARRRRLTMGGGSLVLALALLLQGAYVFRDLLAARFPATKPTLVAVCKLARCQIALPAQIESQSIEGPDLQTLPNGNLVLTALLRNASSLPQAWPYIELELTDADRKPLIRRVFTPKQYLPAATAPGKGFAPGTEQPVKIQFELKQTKASGFNIGVFYP